MKLSNRFYFDRKALLPVGLFMGFIALLAFVDVQEYLRYSRSGIFAGEVWRVFSGHWVHLNMHHALVNLGCFGLFFVFLSGYASIRYWLLSIAWLSTFISACLLAFNPSVTWYVGFSGVLHGLIVQAALLAVLSGKDRWLGLLLLGVFIKVFYEQTENYDREQLASVIGDSVVVEAHLYGLCGSVLAVCPLAIKRIYHEFLFKPS